MDTSNIVVLAAALAAIAWVNWYFFLAGHKPVAAAIAGGMRTMTVVVRGGYDPGTITTEVGQPLRLVFDRQETSSCSEEIVIPEFGIKRFLPAFEKTTVEITPEKAGTYDFMCGMGMLHGKLIVRDR
jgi:plastocyanin domain-containing protein